jgi:DNA-binding NtrC family response regulator
MMGMDMLLLEAPAAPNGDTTRTVNATDTTIVVISDDRALSRSLEAVCDFLDLPIEHIPSDADVSVVLSREHPMAIIVDIDGIGQDGFNVMMTVSYYNRDLPLMLLAGGHPALIGAADAIQELWGLTDVVTAGPDLGVGELVDFCLKARQKAGSTRLLQA